MQVIQTAADPPNHGKISFDMSGWTKNSRQALARIVAPKITCGIRDGEGTATSSALWVAVAAVDNALYLPLDSIF
jgi:hypothetical protein